MTIHRHYRFDCWVVLLDAHVLNRMRNVFVIWISDRLSRLVAVANDVRYWRMGHLCERIHLNTQYIGNKSNAIVVFAVWLSIVQCAVSNYETWTEEKGVREINGWCERIHRCHSIHKCKCYMSFVASHSLRLRLSETVGCEPTSLHILRRVAVSIPLNVR